MVQRTKEEELNIVLKNYGKLKSERDFLKKENEDLKSKLAQQEILYKNMLATYSEKCTDDKFRKRYIALNDKYRKLQENCKKTQEYIEEKAAKLKYLADENIKLKNMLDSLRGALCSAYTRVDDFCDSLNISKRGEDCLSQGGEEKIVITHPKQVPVSVAEYQQQQFIKYIRDVVDIYKKTGALNGIAKLAQKYAVSAITKVKFFQYRLDEEPLSDKEILEVYERLKKKQ